MTLAELLERQFRGDIRFRGEAYVKSERVAITHVTEEIILGSVRDGSEFHTQLARNNGDVKLLCSCVTDSKRKPTCKHVWATVLAADSGGYVSPALKPGHIPPFCVEDDPLDEPIDLYEDVDPDFGMFAPAATRATTASRSPAADPQKPWESTLTDLRTRMEARSNGESGESVERELVYEIDPQRSRETGRLVLQVTQRRRRADGSWGTRKALRVRSDRLDEVDRDDDRRILAFLAGASPEVANAAGKSGNRGGGGSSRFAMSSELGVLVLPLICDTGRVCYADSESRKLSPLTWDAGEPFQLTMELANAEQAGTWALHARLVRDDGAVSVEEVAFLVPGGLVGLEDRIARLEDFDAFDWIDLTGDGSPVVDDGDAAGFVDRLLDMPALPRLNLPEHLKLEEVTADPKPMLFVKTPVTGKRRRWQSEKLAAEVRFDYGGTIVAGSSSRWAIVQRDEGRCLLRNRTREAELWSQLLDAGFRRLRDRRRGEDDAEVAVRELGPAVRSLVEHGWQVRADGKPVRQAGNLHFRVQTHVDWFELQADVDFAEARVTFPELLAALARGDNTIRLDDGSLGLLPEQWMQDFGLLAGIADVDGDTVRLHANQIALLDALLATQESVDYDERFNELRKQLADFEGIEESEEPPEFHGELRHYQREGLGWLQFMREFRFGGCLADDMGLGKTVQVLALLLEQRQARKGTEPSLVVVPKSLMFNWRQEAGRFAPQLKVLEYAGPDRAALRPQFAKHDIVLTTYGTLRRDAVEFKDIPFDYVILDEAQTIKNAGSQVARAARLLTARHRVALSGTPIENHLGDLWSIFEFLNPGMLGRSSAFRSRVADANDEDSRSQLARALRPFILRRTKQQVAHELPEKFEQVILCDMEDEQRRLYDELRAHYRQSLLGMVAEQGLAKSKIHVLEALLRLRQAACHPGLLDLEKLDDPSAKLDVLLPHLEEILDEGHKALVFSQFTSMLAIVRRQLDKTDIDYEYLDGQTRDRQTPVERFQNDPNCGLFLISLKAGGLGLNLTAADYVFLLDPWWNPAVETQAIDRAHRVGQTRNVFAYRLICRNTVEEKISALQQKKKSLAEAILTANDNLLKKLTAEDLELLLS